MRRVERRLFRMNEELERLRREAGLAEGELGMHRHLADDDLRDALVSEAPADRAEARRSASDAARLERALEDVRGRIARLEAERAALLERLDG